MSNNMHFCLHPSKQFIWLQLFSMLIQMIKSIPLFPLPLFITQVHWNSYSKGRLNTVYYSKTLLCHLLRFTVKHHVKCEQSVSGLLTFKQGQKEKEEKEPEEESGHLDGSRSSAGCRGEIKKTGGWVEGWALSFSCSPYGWVCVCVCVGSICALVLEELNRGPARWTTYTQVTVSAHYHHVTRVRQFFSMQGACIQYSHFWSFDLWTEGVLAQQIQKRILWPVLHNSAALTISVSHAISADKLCIQ